MECFCKKTVELLGKEAQEYIHSHLQFVPFPGKTKNDLYLCPETGITWYTDIDPSGVFRLNNPYIRKTDKVLDCQCEQQDELWDNAARDYTDGHLEIIFADNENWRVFYRCPSSDRIWLQERPYSYQQGGGPTLLRRLDITSADLDIKKTYTRDK